MNEAGRPMAVLVGLVRPRNHCTFSWEAAGHDDARTVRVRPNHCSPCIDALRELGYRLAPDEDGRITGGR